MKIHIEKLISQPHEVIRAEPPNIKDLEAVFGVKWSDKQIAVAYGTKIYISFESLDADLYIHELTHIRQQALFLGGEVAWWDKYMNDSSFRLSQELEAYKAQFAYIRQSNVPKHIQKLALEQIARFLSGKLYGELVSYEDALKLIEDSNE